MRLILPTGEDGAERAYPLDGILDLSRATLNEVIELRRVTGMDLLAVNRGLQMLDDLVGLDGDEVLMAMSKHLELMESYRCLVWLARHRAGDRGADGGVLTVEEAMDFPFTELNVVADPGDLVKKPPDPPKRSTAGARAGGRRAAGKSGSRGRSSGTSGRKS